MLGWNSGFEKFCLEFGMLKLFGMAIAVLRMDFATELLWLSSSCFSARICFLLLLWELDNQVPLAGGLEMRRLTVFWSWSGYKTRWSRHWHLMSMPNRNLYHLQIHLLQHLFQVPLQVLMTLQVLLQCPFQCPLQVPQRLPPRLLQATWEHFLDEGMIYTGWSFLWLWIWKHLMSTMHCAICSSSCLLIRSCCNPMFSYITSWCWRASRKTQRRWGFKCRLSQLSFPGKWFDIMDASDSLRRCKISLIN